MSLQRLATLFIACVLFVALPALAANYPAPKQGDWVARDFRFQHSAQSGRNGE